jgi:hypothetical protein
MVIGLAFLVFKNLGLGKRFFNLFDKKRKDTTKFVISMKKEMKL